MTLADGLADGLAEALASGDVLVADGALGTLGFSRGLEGAPALWMRDRPDDVRAMHAEYVAAGARLVVANTFGASRAWVGEDVVALNGAAVRLAREAAGERAWVAGGLGPTGMTGAFEAARAIFEEQASAFVAAGVDAIVVETMSSLDELRAAVEGANAVKGSVPVIASVTVGADGRTRTGAGAVELAALARELGVGGVGANCSEGPASVLALVRELVPLVGIPVFAKPSAGLPGNVLDRAAMLAGLLALVDAGARIVGGCCGTTPDTTADLRRSVP